MAKPISLDESGDSFDLQALFDSIAGSAAPPPPVVETRDAAGDCDDLQALFDSVSAQVNESAAHADSSDGGDVKAAGGDADPSGVAFNRLGHLARQLHDNLRELGYDKLLENTAKQMPDTRERLSYIAQMTEQAASRVLNATDIAKPIQDGILAGSIGLSARWDKMFANQLSVDEFKALAADTRGFFQAMPGKSKAINDQMMEIVMAQDFQDLTGQVIKKVVDMAQRLETDLVQTLIEIMPETRRVEANEGLLNGPVVNAEGRNDVVTDQSQVDELLESLGF
jgi:chemotaxis protein CheZ